MVQDAEKTGRIGRKRAVMNIRKATIADLKILTEIEAECFPPAEAAKEEDIRKRLEIYPDRFWLLEVDSKVVSFIDGMTSDESDLRDEMFQDASLHDPNGKWQMIFGLNTLPAYREKGYAAELIKKLLNDSKEEGRAGAVLTCKTHLVDYYSSFGFVNEGISTSEHGGVSWYQMRAIF